MDITSSSVTKSSALPVLVTVPWYTVAHPRARSSTMKWDVWHERERGTAFCGHQWAQHATDKDNVSGYVQFHGWFLRCLEIMIIITYESLIGGETGKAR
jgi:hypothetical protein